MQLTWQGVNYEVPASEPPQDRRIETLHPIFWGQLSAWMRFAQRYTPHQIRISETRRTLERQLWLLSLGRVNPGPIRSRTLDSRHRHGLAADIYLQDTKTGKAEWRVQYYQSLYADAPPAWFGLTPVSFEYVHLELASADSMLTRAAELGIIQS